VNRENFLTEKFFSTILPRVKSFAKVAHGFRIVPKGTIQYETHDQIMVGIRTVV
jgi:hypothetical protein